MNTLHCFNQPLIEPGISGLLGSHVTLHEVVEYLVFCFWSCICGCCVKYRIKHPVIRSGLKQKITLRFCGSFYEYIVMPSRVICTLRKSYNKDMFG